MTNEPEETVAIPQLPTGRITPELLAECSRICKETGLVLVPYKIDESMTEVVESAEGAFKDENGESVLGGPEY